MHQGSYYYIKRLENINLETQLEHKRKSLEDLIKDLKLELRNSFIVISGLKKEVEDLEMELGILGNFMKISGLEDKFAKNFKGKSDKFDKTVDVENMMKLNKMVYVSNYILIF